MAIAWFTESERVRPGHQVLVHVFSSRCDVVTRALAELSRHMRVHGSTGGYGFFSSGRDCQRSNVPELGAYQGTAQGNPFRDWQVRELVAQLRRVTGDHGLRVQVGETDVGEFGTWVGDLLGEDSTILGGATDVGQGAQNVAAGAVDTVVGAGQLARDVGAGVRGVGDVSRASPMLFGWLLLGVAGFVAWKVYVR